MEHGLRNRLSQQTFAVFVLTTVSLLLGAGVEFIQRGNMHETFHWVIHNFTIFALNGLLALNVMVTVYCIIGSFITSMALSTLLLSVISLVSYFKTKLIGEPFFPWDILLNKEGMNIAPLVTGKEALLRISLIVTVVAALFMLRFICQRFPITPWKRVLFGLFSIATLCSFALKMPWVEKLLNHAGITEIVWNQQQNYRANGFLLAFTLNVKSSIISKPPGYGEQSIRVAAKHIADQRTTNEAESMIRTPAKKPNVIFIMNEAFWDPTLLSKVTFSEDPVPTVHRLQKKYSSGSLLSPEFGGRTSNVEFEVLTGYSMSFLPTGSVPYQQYMKKPVPSLAGYFENQGYKSMAVHSYEGWFWNRESVYKWMGFESFKSKQAFHDPEYKGTFISDNEVSRFIIKEVDETEKPMFIYAVTMQNHGPYDDNRYGSNSIHVQGNLTDDGKRILETYTHGARDADQSLQLLLDHFESSGEPTIIVFFGDHLPMLGYHYDVYKQAGFIHTERSEEWTLDELKRMHSVPFVTWSNFPMQQEHVHALSDSFLGAYILKALSMEQPAQFAFNSGLSRKLPGLLRNLVIDGENKLGSDVPDSLKMHVEEYRYLQYDMLFGKQFLPVFIESKKGMQG